MVPTPAKDGRDLYAEAVKEGYRLAGLPEPRARLEALALEYHKTVEGEYGCPGQSCPGVKRLVLLLVAAVDDPPSEPALDRRGYWTARYAARHTAAALITKARELGVPAETLEALETVAGMVAYD